MKLAILTVTLVLLCAFVDAQPANNANKYTATTAFTIPGKDLIPECITYDAKTNQFFVGSIYKRKVIAISAKGGISDFIPAGSDGLGAILGIKVDDQKRCLWILASNTPFIPTNATTNDTGYTTAVFKYGIYTRQVQKRYLLKDTAVFFNDLAITDAGDIFITDTYSGSIYTINHERDTLELFMPKKSFTEPNGITAYKNNLFIAFATGIANVNIAGNQIQIIRTKNNDSIGGIDGLHFYNKGFIGVQNGILPKKIINIHLDNSLISVDKINTLYMSASPPGVYSPTTGVIVGNRFYFIYNAQVRSFDKDGKIFSMDKLQPVLIKSIPLQQR